MLGCAIKSDRPFLKTFALVAVQEREHLHLLLDNCENLDKTHKETTLEEIVRVVPKPAYLRTLPVSLRTTPRTPHVRPTYPCVCLAYAKYLPKKGATKMEVSLRLPFSHPCRLIASDPFTDVSVIVSQGGVVSRLAPDRRPARWWPVALSILGLRSLKRHPSGTNLHCDKGHTVVTHATATGAEDMAIPLDPPGQGRHHERSRWSRPGSCRTRSYHGPPRRNIPSLRETG